MAFDDKTIMPSETFYSRRRQRTLVFQSKQGCYSQPCNVLFYGTQGFTRNLTLSDTSGQFGQPESEILNSLYLIIRSCPPGDSGYFQSYGFSSGYGREPLSKISLTGYLPAVKIALQIKCLCLSVRARVTVSTSWAVNSLLCAKLCSMTVLQLLAVSLTCPNDAPLRDQLILKSRVSLKRTIDCCNRNMNIRTRDFITILTT